MSQNEMLSMVRELKSLEQLIEEAQQEAEAIKDRLKEQMKASGTDEIVVDIFKVRWKAVKSNRFDTNSFKSTHKELYEQYTKYRITEVHSHSMKNKKAYKFALWKRDVLKNLHSPLNPEPTESDFPTIDFERIYFMMPNPVEASEVVRAVHAFTKDEYKIVKREKPI